MNFRRICITTETSQSSDCIISYQQTVVSVTVASGVSLHISFKLYNREEGTVPMWPGCLSPQSLNPSKKLSNVELKRKQSRQQI